MSRHAVTDEEPVILDDLGDRTEAHAGRIIFIRRELDAVEAACNERPVSKIDMVTLPEELVEELKRDGKVGDSFSVFDATRAVHYLAVQGRVTLPNKGNGQLGRHFDDD